MKKIYLIVLILFVSKVNYAYNETKLLAAINKWNELHNGGDVDDFLNLYTSEVYFYGKLNTAAKCYDLKNKFLNENFSQEIITAITIEEYENNILKCDFTKEVTFNGKIKQHNCYLLLKEIDGEYYVYGESDYETESKKGISANIGQPINSEQKIVTYSVVGNNNWVYIAIGIAICVVGLFLFKKFKNKKDTPEPIYNTYDNANELATASTVDKDAIKEMMREVLVEIEQKQKTNTILTSHEKGVLFEKYIVNLLNVNYFTVLEWRSDKRADNGLAPITNSLPDLEIQYSDTSSTEKFAIECKWRQSFKNDAIEWSSDYQLNNYLNYQNKNRIPVFVVIGVGGTPDKPDELYITTLNNLSQYPNVFKSFLRQFGRSTTSQLYYNKVNKILS